MWPSGNSFFKNGIEVPLKPRRILNRNQILCRRLLLGKETLLLEEEKEYTLCLCKITVNAGVFIVPCLNNEMTRSEGSFGRGFWASLDAIVANVFGSHVSGLKHLNSEPQSSHFLLVSSQVGGFPVGGFPSTHVGVGGTLLLQHFSPIWAHLACFGL